MSQTIALSVTGLITAPEKSWGGEVNKNKEYKLFSLVPSWPQVWTGAGKAL